MLRRSAPLFALTAFTLLGCTTLASSPSWVGGTLADGAPERIEREEVAIRKETEQILSEPKTIGAKHILVMHKESERRPPTVTRTKAEAKARAEEALAKVRGGADFDKAVIEYSDEPGAAERAGDLGVFEKKVMVKAFSDAAFKLKVGEVSDIIETPFGFHVIKRTN